LQGRDNQNRHFELKFALNHSTPTCGVTHGQTLVSLRRRQYIKSPYNTSAQTLAMQTPTADTDCRHCLLTLTRLTFTGAHSQKRIHWRA